MRYVNECDNEFATDLRSEPGGGDRVCRLIWGDPVHELAPGANGFVRVRARDRTGYVAVEHLTDDGLLEFYVIDVGQGDGILVRTPDDKWHVIDGGVKNFRQMTGKGAANFIRWKFRRDLRIADPVLESVTISHPDFDHYGGLINLFSGDLEDGEAPFEVSVENLYHSGMGRFEDDEKLGAKQRGTLAERFPIGGRGLHQTDSFITELLDGKESFAHPPRSFQATFDELAQWVAAKARHVRRLGCSGASETWFPGYSPVDDVRGPGDESLTIKVLGPVIEAFENDSGRHEGLRCLASESKTRNGHSIVLRFDYGRARILMNGDLNSESQRLLLSYFPAAEYEVDVAKGCHHGSEDVDLEFLRAMKAKSTVLSSGDNESYSHPRPLVIGASGHYGRVLRTVGDRPTELPPLVYSTELARSTRLAMVERVRVDHDADPGTRMRSYPSDRAQVRARGDKYRSFSSRPVSTNLVYGLVNVRTDGAKIMCATLEEVGTDFDIKVFEAG